MKTKISSILVKQKLIVLMGKDFAITKVHRKSSMVSSKMDNLKEWGNFTSQVETTTLVSSSLTKRMEEVYISGQERSLTSMKVSSWKERETEEEHFGGLTVAGMKGSLGMGFRVGSELCIGMEGTKNTKDIGTTVCSMGREFNSLRTDRSMRELLRRISSMETGYFTRMTR